MDINTGCLKMAKLIQLKQKDLLPLRKKQWEKQDKKCPILDKEIPFEKSVLDHCHISKKRNQRRQSWRRWKRTVKGCFRPCRKCLGRKGFKKFYQSWTTQKEYRYFRCIGKFSKVFKETIN